MIDDTDGVGVTVTSSCLTRPTPLRATSSRQVIDYTDGSHGTLVDGGSAGGGGIASGYGGGGGVSSTHDGAFVLSAMGALVVLACGCFMLNYIEVSRSGRVDGMEWNGME